MTTDPNLAARWHGSELNTCAKLGRSTRWVVAGAYRQMPERITEGSNGAVAAPSRPVADIEVRPMLVIEWLSRLPRADGVVILERQPTDCATEVDAKSQALLLWPTIVQFGSRSPDGFQVVDQDGVSARLILHRKIE